MLNTSEKRCFFYSISVTFAAANVFCLLDEKQLIQMK